MPYYVHDKIISPNIWDEEWEEGTLNTTTGMKTYAPGIIRSKNYIEVSPNTELYCYTNGYGAIECFYDSNYNYIGYTNVYDDYFTTPSNAKFMLFRLATDYGATYKHDICINVSNPAINGHYYPYNMGAKKYVIKDNNNSMNIGG